MERSLPLIKELEREHKQVMLSVARRVISPASAVSIASSLEKVGIPKIKGEYITGYKELEVVTSS